MIFATFFNQIVKHFLVFFSSLKFFANLFTFFLLFFLCVNLKAFFWLLFLPIFFVRLCAYLKKKIFFCHL